VHIVFATMQFGPGYYQGTERYIANLAKGLLHQGYRISVIAGDPLQQWSKEIKQLATEEGISIYATDTLGWSAVEGMPVESYVKRIQELKPDICHLVNPGHIGINFISAAQHLGLPSIITMTDYWWLCPKNTLTRVDGSLCSGFESPSECWRCISQSHRNSNIRSLSQKPLISFTATALLKLKAGYYRNSKEWPQRKQIISESLQNSGAIICLSKTGLKAINEYFDCKNTHYIPVGLADEWIQDGDKPKLSKDKVKLGFIGTISRHKGLTLLIKAIALAANVKDIELHIAGSFDDSEYEKEVMQACQEINAIFHGRLDESQVRKLIDEMNATVVPSQSPENQPQVILESFARKTAVISSKAPGAAELLLAEYTFSTAHELQLLIEDIAKISANYQIPAVSSYAEMTERTVHLYQKICAY
jgi:glycosyltransferase involved in cell wall biosynthesis